MNQDEDLLIELRSILLQLDQLAEIWGDEGVFRRCRDRLRNLCAKIEGQSCN